jgi:hypothetical protein
MPDSIEFVVEELFRYMPVRYYTGKARLYLSCSEKAKVHNLEVNSYLQVEIVILSGLSKHVKLVQVSKIYP